MTKLKKKKIVSKLTPKQKAERLALLKHIYEVRIKPTLPSYYENLADSIVDKVLIEQHVSLDILRKYYHRE